MFNTLLDLFDGATSEDRLIPLTDWPDYHPWPSVGGLRHIRFFAEEKGATHCFVKSGGRVKVREKRFLEWADTNESSQSH